MRRDLYGLFDPLAQPAQDEWAEVVRLPTAEYLSRLADQAKGCDCRQEHSGETVRWLGRAGNLELMLFRTPDPGDLGTIRAMYETLDETSCPIAFAFVNQRADHADAWDVFHFSRLSYLCHANPGSGPGSACRR